jgi:ABC-type antimicrobial peptide transport system permease subunit
MIAIFLACLGLFSLSQFSVLQRIKEVGIRKAIGARSFNIVLLFMQDLLIWVAISFCISSPIAYYISYSGIKNFEDHVSISWWVFILAGLIALFIGILTIIFHTLRAAMRNPVKALRYE